jgi:hypothetical protein
LECRVGGHEARLRLRKFYLAHVSFAIVVGQVLVCAEAPLPEVIRLPRLHGSAHGR